MVAMAGPEKGGVCADEDDDGCEAGGVYLVFLHAGWRRNREYQ